MHEESNALELSRVLGLLKDYGQEDYYRELSARQGAEKFVGYDE